MQAEVLDSMRVKMRSVEESDAVILVATPQQPSSVDAGEVQPVAILELFIGEDRNIIDTIELGAGVAERPERYAWLASMAVSSQFRRQGCARALLDAVHEKLHELQCEWAVLSVFPDNQAAMRLYESQGYMSCGEQDTSVLDFLGWRSRVIMLRPRDDVRSTLGAPL